MVSLNYSAKNIELIILNLKLEKINNNAKKFINLYKEAFLRDIISADELRKNLESLELESFTIEKIIKECELENAIKTVIATKAELFKFFRQNIISEKILKEELLKRKYDKITVSWLIASLKKDIEEDEKTIQMKEEEKELKAAEKAAKELEKELKKKGK